jgi:hypothetical protein
MRHEYRVALVQIALSFPTRTGWRLDHGLRPIGCNLPSHHNFGQHQENQNCFWKDLIQKLFSINKSSKDCLGNDIQKQCLKQENSYKVFG